MKALKCNLGNTLLELLLVLGVVVVILLGTLQLVRYHSYQQNVAKLQGALSVTLVLMNQYYYGQPAGPAGGALNCLAGSNLTNKTLADLKAWGTASQSFSANELSVIQNPIGSAPVITFQNNAAPTATPIYVFKISMAFPNLSSGTLTLLQNQLNADPDSNIVAKTLTWTRLPRQSIDKINNSDFWISNLFLQSKVKIAYTDAGSHPGCPI